MLHSILSWILFFVLPCMARRENMRTLSIFGHEYGGRNSYHGSYHHDGHHGENMDIEFGSGEDTKDRICKATGACPTERRPNCCWLYHTSNHEDCCFCSNNALNMDMGDVSDVIINYHVGGWCEADRFMDIFRHNEFECCTGGVACCVSPMRRYRNPHDHGNFAHTEEVKEFHNGHLLAIIIVCVSVLVVGIVTTCILRVKHKNAASRARRSTMRVNRQNTADVAEPPPYDYIMRSLSRTQSCQPDLKIAAKRTQSDGK